MTQNRRKVGAYDYTIGAVESGAPRYPEVWVTLDLPAPMERGMYALSPTMARALSRKLKKWADLADPPKRRRA